MIPEGPGTRYLDEIEIEIEIEGGRLTPLFAAFAHVFYRYRQARWRRLVRSRSL